MKTFKYSAISRNGAKVSGIVEAFDEFAAVSEIKESCSAVVRIEEVRQGRAPGETLFTPKVSEKALAVMCSQFSIILGAGLPVMRAVKLIAEQTTDKTLRRILNDAVGDVSAGFTLARSLENKGGALLPITLIETIRSGEESGTLEEAFRRLHAYYDKTYKLKGKVRSAMIYPAFTVLVAIVVVAIIMGVAVPRFIDTFLSMGIELPWPTRALIATSNFFVQYWWAMAFGIAALLLGWKLWGRSAKGRVTQDRWKLHYPVLGKMNHMRAASQFANTMNTMLAAGVSMVRAVAVTARVLDNAYIGRQLDLQTPKLEAGRTLTRCLKNFALFPSLLVEMTGVGEETGSLESTLQVIGEYYDNETEVMSQRALSLLEPIIICLLAGIVVIILLAVYLPMLGMYQSF